MDKLTKATDWQKIEKQLHEQYAVYIHSYRNIRLTDYEVEKVINAMAHMVKQISQEEVIARQTGRDKKLKEMLKEFNEHLVDMEQQFLLHLLTRGQKP